MQKKIIHSTILVLVCLVMFGPTSVLADDSPKDKGKMEWKLDRVIKGDSDEKEDHRQNAFEKDIPDLFKEETQTKIQSVQKKEQETKDELHHDIFSDKPKKETDTQHLKAQLFTDEYVVPSSIKHADEDETAKGIDWLNDILILGLSVLACMICVGVYFMFRKLSD